MSPRARATSTNVAELAGVSQSAVSRVFTPGASVSPQTREKVLAAAAQLKYRPNAIARTLITNKSRLIGVVTPYLDNPFYSDVLQQLSGRLQEHAFQVLLFTGFRNKESEKLLARILQYNVDGLIFASTTLSSAFAAECDAAGVPVVLFNRTTRRDEVSSVTSNNLRGGRHVAEFLLAGGHSRFAYVAGITTSSTNRDRESSFVKHLRAAGHNLSHRVEANYSYTEALGAARSLFSSAHPPDAVFCANDQMAMAVIEVARSEFGLRVPQDVSIIGYDDVKPAGWPSFDLTTVEQPVAPMVDTTVEFVLKRILSDVVEPLHRVFDGDLVVRGSARIPADGVIESDGRRIWRPERITQNGRQATS